MKKFIKIIIINIISFIILMGAIAFAVMIFPEEIPTGQDSNGLFIDYFNNMKGECTNSVIGGFVSGMIKNCITE